ncbi:VWA domain-containing protein [Herbiconiux sp. L3-i23]|uniref:vWA domain-containing protein n=1 Tax=Herbiconiux sp. L3-i23 TaxID=2905871 RepID=UPI002069C5AF|nr:vWA domain-containing protein [Herbiconiux sp. L3-i23]BDI22522.1 hypothetical protein L3i23_12980 [Herbiconiux sp. L3-i23]
MFEPSAGSGGFVLQPRARERAAGGETRPGGVVAGFTDEKGELVGIDEFAEVDQLVRQRARQIASRLALRKPRNDASARRGVGDLMSMPYRGGSDDIDLDRTIELLAERPMPEDEDIIVRDRMRTGRSVVLAVDVSGSMKGERVRTAAATVGALAAELQRDDLGVLAFWSDAAILLPLGADVRPLEVLDDLLRIPARGLTNVSFPLEIAATQLAGAPARDSRVVLLSDCVHNAGPDPRVAAARLPRLDVLLDTSGEKDVELGRDLARVGRGRFRAIRSFHDVAPALSALFSE